MKNTSQNVLPLAIIGICFLIYSQFSLPYRSTIFLTGLLYEAAAAMVLVNLQHFIPIILRQSTSIGLLVGQSIRRRTRIYRSNMTTSAIHVQQKIAALAKKIRTLSSGKSKKTPQTAYIGDYPDTEQIANLWDELFSNRGLVLLTLTTVLVISFYFLAFIRFINAHDGITMFYIWQGLE